MKITLGTRTAETAVRYFKKTNNEAIRRVLPQRARTVEEALRDYEATLLPAAASYGRTILADGRHIGDIWCYCIDPSDTPNTMVSYCVFERQYWNQGAASEALRLFLAEIMQKFELKTVGAFTFSSNHPSIRVLLKNDFELREEFTEDGVPSRYFQYER